MKKLLTGCLALVLCTSCGNGKNGTDPFDALTRMVDSVGFPSTSVSAIDSAVVLKPLEADELFDDFIFNYALDRTLQMQRTVFPLPYDCNGELKRIEKDAWQHDNLFAEQNFYTLMFDRERDMDVVGDTALTSVQVEWLYLQQREVQRYYFQRKRGMWMLDSISRHKIPEEENMRSGFISFYARFVTDSLYQRQHIHSPLMFVTLDPDDEFSILETTLDVDQWYAFRPIMPIDPLSNICYGQPNNPNSSTKILKVNGIGNGYSNIFYFRKRHGEWELYKYEDTSI